MQSTEPRPCSEPTLDEMLADPIVRMLMERDGLTDESVRGTFEDAAKRMRTRAGERNRAA